MTSFALLTPAVYAASGHGDSTCHQGMHGGHKGYHGHMHKMLSSLDLTEAQQSKVKALMQANRETMRQMRPSDEARKANHDQMLQLITADNFSERDVQALAAKRSQRHAQMLMERIKLHRAIYQILTPEQQTKFKEEFATSGAHKGGRR